MGGEWWPVDGVWCDHCSLLTAHCSLLYFLLTTRCLLHGSDALPVESLSTLVNILPSADELEVLRAYEGPHERLGKVERFFLAVGAVPRLAARVQAARLGRQGR